MSDPVRHTITTAIEAFRGYIDLVLPSLTQVIYANQSSADAARPALPYATIEPVSSHSLATPTRRVGDTLDEPEGAEDELTEEYELTWWRETVVAVNLYGDAGPALVEKLDASRARWTAIAYLETKEIAIRPVSDVLDTLVLRDTVHEATARQDWAIVYTAEDLTSVGTIETLSYNGDTFDLTIPED